MIGFKYLSREDVKKVMKMAPVIECVENVYCQKSEGDTVVWPTTFYEFEPGKADMDIKSGYLRGEKLYGHKTVAWFGENKAKGMQDVLGLIAVYSAEDGTPVGILDASYITGMRTGAAGAIGAKYLARKDSKNLLVTGAGNQAAFQIAATLTAFPELEKVTVMDLKAPENAKAFVENIPNRLAEEFGIQVPNCRFMASESMEEALSYSDIVITVTPAKEAYIKKEWVRPGTHFSCIGADAAGKQELESAIFQGARVFVDDRSHNVSDGEIELPIKQGVISENDIIGEIGDLILKKAKGRQSEEEVTIFDAVGMALLDIAAAKVAMELADENGLGTAVRL